MDAERSSSPTLSVRWFELDQHPDTDATLGQSNQRQDARSASVDSRGEDRQRDAKRRLQSYGSIPELNTVAYILLSGS